VGKECYDKVLNEEFKKILMCKMKNVITRKTMASKKNSDVPHISDEMVGVYI